MSQKLVKIVAVGDPTVGKSSIFISFTSSGFLKDYVPTTFDNFNKTLATDRGMVSLNLWDTAGQDELAHLRQLSYTQADVFLLVFSTVSPSSFENLYTKWLPEMKQFGSNVPFMIVGSKIDLRDAPGYRGEYITTSKGREFARQVEALGYVECSAFTHDGLMNVFDKTVEALWEKEKRMRGARANSRATKRDKCVMM